MQTLPLIGGSYSARSVIANAQRCLNLYPEANREDSPAKMTLYQRPGLVPLVIPTSFQRGRGRMLYQASNGDGYAVIGDVLYLVDQNWTLHPLGTITNETTPCSMVDNGTQAIIVTGVPYAGNAAGTITFAGNPSPGDTVTLNGVVWTFIAGPSSGNDVHIEGTLGFTLAQFQVILAASTDPLISTAVYGVNATQLMVTNKVSGALGTTYTLAASVATPSGARLALGTVFPGPGWTFSLGALGPGALTQISDPAWTGADRVDYIDTFIVWNQPGTRNFGSTLSNQILPLDATYVAGKTGWPDPLQTIIVNKEQVILPGALKTETWYNSGSSQFPFARLSGTFVEHGILAKYSIASQDNNVYWLARDLQGQAFVVKLSGNAAVRISNYALEYALRLLWEAGTDISDAIGYTYQQDGHSFYVLSFPSGNQTWVWDESVGDPELGWHQRTYTDENGGQNRVRGTFGAWLYGKNVVLDWENGTIYEQSLTTYTDTVAVYGTTVVGVEHPITYLRSFPHLVIGESGGQPILGAGRMIQHQRFLLDAECGTVETQDQPVFSLRWSDDRGKTWGNAVLQSAGALGKYETRPEWTGIGQAMDRVYEVSWSFPGPVAIQGAWVEGAVLPR